MQTYQTRRKTPGRGAVPGKGQDISKSEMLHLSGAGAPQPMSPALREKFEPGFQADFSNIRISRGHIPEEMGVQAVAQGTDILLDQSAGMDVLGHELAHVVQQAQGRVDGGYPVVENAALEHEADVMGARVASGLTAQAGTQNGFGGEMMSIAPMSSASAPAQCKSKEEKAAEKAAKAQRAEEASEMEMLNATFAEKGDMKKINAMVNQRAEINDAMSQQDMANLTPSQKQQAAALLRRGAEEKSEREVDFQAVKQRYEQGGKTFHPASSHHMRYLQRHLTGLDAAEQDKMFQAFAEDDQNAMAGYLRRDLLSYDEKMKSLRSQFRLNNSTDALLQHYDEFRSLNQDRMTPSDFVKQKFLSPEQLGFTPKEYDKLTKTATGFGTLSGFYQARLKRMANGTPAKEDPVITPAPAPAPATTTTQATAPAPTQSQELDWNYTQNMLERAQLNSTVPPEWFDEVSDEHGVVDPAKLEAKRQAVAQEQAAQKKKRSVFSRLFGR